MIAECIKREKECQLYRGEVKLRTVNLSMMFAMISSPILCDMFYKAKRKQYEADEIKQHND